MLRKIINKFRQIFSKDDVHEFKPLLVEIEESPVSPLGRVIFWIIIFIMIFTASWLYFGKVDVVISARGKIIPDGEMKILQPLDTGVVQSILVKEGDFVKKGQVVMEINPSNFEPVLESSQKNLSHIKMEIARLKATSEGGHFAANNGHSELAKIQKDLYSSTLDSLKNQLAAKELELKKVEDRINAINVEKNNYQTLLSTTTDRKKRLEPVVDIIPKDQYDKVITDISTYESKIQESNYRLDELMHQRRQIMEEIAYIQQSFKSQNLKELSDKQKQATQLIAQIEEASFKTAKQKIVSPVDGHVNTLFVHTVGGVVTPAEKLMSIVPEKTPVIIKAVVLNKDIGFVKPDMSVSIKIDTFEFQKYGILKGKVKTVSKNSIEDEKLGPVYEVFITPVDKSLVVEGKERFISPGMSLTAEIKVHKRRVIEFFIYPLIKYWNEGITVR